MTHFRSITVCGGAMLMALTLQAGSVGAQAPAGGRAGGPATPAVAPTSPVTGNATRGKQLYYDYSCYSCHGFNGETGARPFVPNWTPMLATEGSFTAFLRGRADRAPVTPSTAMPNYAVETLSDAQAKDIYAFIRSFKSNQPTVDKIATMNQILTAAQRPYKP